MEKVEDENNGYGDDGYLYDEKRSGKKNGNIYGCGGYGGYGRGGREGRDNGYRDINKKYG